jgi:hypothetical protein
VVIGTELRAQSCAESEKSGNRDRTAGTELRRVRKEW